MVHPIEVEPYWNVNEMSELTITMAESIEVEPYWNVNGWIFAVCNKLEFD